MQHQVSESRRILPDLLFAALASFLGGVLAFIFTIPLRVAISGCIGLVVQEPQQIPLLLQNWVIISLVSLFAGIAILALYVYVDCSTRPIRFRELKCPYRESWRFSLLQALFFAPLLRSQVRMMTAASILIAIVVFFVGLLFLPPILLAILEVLIVLDLFREFATSYAGTKEAFESLIGQMILTFTKAIIYTLNESLGHEGFRIRSHLMLYDSHINQLHLVYGYGMKGAPDQNLAISPDQCVRGEAFRSRSPFAANPFDPTNLGYSPHQIQQLPADIKWMVAFPLAGMDGQAFGVLGVDCNVEIDQEWLDKLLDFGEGSTQMIAITHLLYQTNPE